MEKEMNLFAYGTLMWPEVFEAVAGRRRASEPATLAGHKRLRVKGAVYPVVVRSLEDSVEGVLYRGLTEEEFRRLDAFEGAAYERIELDFDGTRAFVYALAEAWSHIAEDAPWAPDQLAPDDLLAFQTARANRAAP